MSDIDMDGAIRRCFRAGEAIETSPAVARENVEAALALLGDPRRNAIDPFELRTRNEAQDRIASAVAGLCLERRQPGAMGIGGNTEDLRSALAWLKGQP